MIADLPLEPQVSRGMGVDTGTDSLGSHPVCDVKQGPLGSPCIRFPVKNVGIILSFTAEGRGENLIK